MRRNRRPIARAALLHRLDLLARDFRDRATILRDHEAAAATMVLDTLRLLLVAHEDGIDARLVYEPENTTREQPTRLSLIVDGARRPGEETDGDLTSKDDISPSEPSAHNATEGTHGGA